MLERLERLPDGGRVLCGPTTQWTQPGRTRIEQASFISGIVGAVRLQQKGRPRTVRSPST